MVYITSLDKIFFLFMGSSETESSDTEAINGPIALVPYGRWENRAPVE